MGSQFEWGQQYGGVSSIDDCYKLPSQLQNGCKFRFEWFQGAENPAINFQPVACPAELTNISGCSREQKINLVVWKVEIKDKSI